MTRESKECFHLLMQVARQVIKAAQENIEDERARQKGKLDEGAVQMQECVENLLIQASKSVKDGGVCN